MMAGQQTICLLCSDVKNAELQWFGFKPKAFDDPKEI